MHMQFYHPTPIQLHNLMKRVNTEETKAETTRTLERIGNECEEWKEFHSGPLRFRVAISTKNIVYNSDVAISFMCLQATLSPLLC